MHKSGDDKYMEMREFARVDALIPLDVRLVLPEERHEIVSKISGETALVEFQELADVQDRHLSDWLKMLNAKLDVIVNILTFQREGFHALTHKPANISGNGLKFVYHEKFNPGDVIEIKMLFLMMPSIALYVYGEVIDVESQINGYSISVKFIAIDEDVRDTIIKFVFKKQRDILREKRK